MKFAEISLIVNITNNVETHVDLNETMHATPIGTTNHKNNVLVLLLVTISALLETRGAVIADEKWRCKQIYIHLEVLYWREVFSKIFRKFPEKWE